MCDTLLRGSRSTVELQFILQTPNESSPSSKMRSLYFVALKLCGPTSCGLTSVWVHIPFLFTLSKEVPLRASPRRHFHPRKATSPVRTQTGRFEQKLLICKLSVLIYAVHDMESFLVPVCIFPVGEGGIKDLHIIPRPKQPPATLHLVGAVSCLILFPLETFLCPPTANKRTPNGGSFVCSCCHSQILLCISVNPGPCGSDGLMDPQCLLS